jgi:type IV pilus assembly protein PilW
MVLAMKRIFPGQHANGFTLVELLVAMFLTFIAAVGMYKMLVAYNASSEIMDQLVELQQNCRIAMGRMTDEIRMAAYDPTTTSPAKISPASNATRFIFSMDLNEDGDVLDPDENIIYSLADLDGDGVNDLVRNDINGGGAQQVITNVSALEFLYVDEDGNPVAAGPFTSSVEIAMVVKTTNEDYRIIDNFNYQTRRGLISGAILYTPPAEDHFRRRLVEQTVKCRNNGL